MQRTAARIQQPRLRRARRQRLAPRALLRCLIGLWPCLASAGLASCSFGEEEAAAEHNSCSVDADCSSQHCEAGRCVTRVESQLEVTLVVTPKRTPDGTQPLPIVSEPFTLDSGGPRDIELRLPVSVPVRVVHDGKPIAAQVSFTPLETSNRFTAKTTKLNVLAPSKDDVEPANNAMLLDGAKYRVLIQPADATLPPHSQLFTAHNGDRLAVDYADVETHQRKFVIRNAARAPYQVHAVSEASSDPISTTGPMNGNLSGVAVVNLTFDADDSPYRLEFTPTDQQLYSTGSAGSCGDETPLPRLSLPSSSFVADIVSSNTWHVDLPSLYPAIEYSGVIDLCEDQKLMADLQVTLKTEDLYLASGDAETVQGGFETAAAASWQQDSGNFRFCARIPPGTYTVVVTPSPNLNCEIFAEKRVLSPDWGGDPDELSLSKPAMLSANVLTPDRMPMPKATVDLLALASSDIVQAPSDRSVASYNRSGSVATDADGSFSLSVDRGKYDVFIKPPETSNYAWRVIYDVAIAANSAEFATEIMLSEPVAVTGKLSYMAGSQSDQKSLADAEVRAYTLVDVEGKTPSQRSVEIGSGHADSSGVVTLLLPPSLQRSWNP